MAKKEYYRSIPYYIWIYWEQFRCHVLNWHSWFRKGDRFEDSCSWCLLSKEDAKKRLPVISDIVIRIKLGDRYGK